MATDTRYCPHCGKDIIFSEELVIDLLNRSLPVTCFKCNKASNIWDWKTLPPHSDAAYQSAKERLERTLSKATQAPAPDCPSSFERPSRVYDLRQAGRLRCATEGTAHYKSPGHLEPIDLMYDTPGVLQGFCLGNIIKYAYRYARTHDLLNLIKIADYAHILAGAHKDENKEGLTHG